MTENIDTQKSDAVRLIPRRRCRKVSKRQEFVRGMDAMYFLAAILVIYMMFFRVVMVVGPSMYNTLMQGDRLLLVSGLLYTEPKQGDIVVCSKDDFEGGQCFIKRVIAVEGQEVYIDFATGKVEVDGEELDEPYLYSPTMRDEGVDFPLVVGEGQVFVMGDNRMRSTDSRSPDIGLVDEREILGKAVFLIIPGNNGGSEKAQWSRIGWIG